MCAFLCLNAFLVSQNPSTKRKPDGYTPPDVPITVTAHVEANSGDVAGAQLVWRVNYGPEQRTAMAAEPAGALGSRPPIPQGAFRCSLIGGDCCLRRVPRQPCCAADPSLRLG